MSSAHKPSTSRFKSSSVTISVIGSMSDFPESEFQVEALGAVEERMDEQHPHADGVRRGEDAQHGVLQQVGAEAFALHGLVHRQTRQQDCRAGSGMLRRARAW